MRSVDYDGEVLRIKFTAAGNAWIDLVAIVKSLPGREFLMSEKTWVAPPLKNTLSLLQQWNFVFTPRAKQLLEEGAVVPVVDDFPVHLFKNFRPYQIEGVKFVHARKGRALIGDEMGLGKTWQAIGYGKLHPKKRPILVICPASVKVNWQREIYKLTGETSIIISGRKPEQLKRSNWYIANYDILAEQYTDDKGKPALRGWIKEFEKISLSVIIVDECQQISNQKTIRTKAVKYLVKKLNTDFIPLSGTPIKNRPAEFFTVLNLLDNFRFPNRWKYLNHYCDPKSNGFGMTYNGATNIEELNELVSQVMIRRLKKDVLPELPPKQRSVIPMELDKKFIQEYKSASEDFMDWLAEHKSGLDSQGLLEKMKQAAYIAKRNSVINWIEDFLETGEKLIIFAWHIKAIEDIMGHFKKIAVKIDGSVLDTKRQAAIDTFQNDPNCKLFVGQILAAGQGITLTAASNVAFIELGWTPGDHEQAEDRPHRIGQKADSVNIYYLIAENTVEEDIMELLQEKYAVVKQILDGEANGVLFGDRGVSMMSEVVNKMRNKVAGR